MNIQDAVEHCYAVLLSKKVESPRLSAELLVEHATHLTRVEIMAGKNRPLSAHEEAYLNQILARRSRHEPIPYITGKVEFYSIPLQITPGVFIPRPDTETLVDAALEIARLFEHPPKVYDLATGSGCIVVALAKHLEDGEFWASDVSNTAIQVAANNARLHELRHRVELREGSLFSPLRNELNTQFDLVVSNPPYIKTYEISKLDNQIKDFEPIIALDGGRDGMTFIRGILDGASRILKPGGYVLLEADPTLTELIRTEALRRNYEDIVVHRDASGKERVVQFRRKGGI